MENQWLGQEKCKHYRGVKNIIGRVCCGGKVRQKVKLACTIHKRIYANSCRKDICGYYEEGEK